jgi:hypothetical protein
MLALFILGKESITSTNVDVYLEPFIKELQVLWACVKTYDAYQWEPFNLRAMCMWNICDFHA